MKKFNIHFFIILALVFTVAISDIFIYILKSNFIFTNIIVGLGIIALSYLLKKKKIIKFETNFSKTDLIFIVFLVIYLIASIVFPDLSWDTRSYHIYLQENVFEDKINQDFFAGRNLNSFLFALGDRVNYLFRIILGYRLGTIISYYLMLVLFYQVKRVLQKILENKNEKLISIFSIFPVIMSVIFSYTGSYYIDNFGLIFLMEIFYIILFEENILKEKIKLYTVSILVGISIGMKVTNIIFLIPLAIVFLLKNFKNLKELKIYDYILVILFLILPWGIYGINSYIQTGNPVFPYYNNIFKSEYFKEESWTDTNFGPRNIIQFLIWPIYIVFNPKSAFDSRFVDVGWGIGFIAIFGYIIYSLKNKKTNTKIFELSIIVFINYYIWQLLLIGYVRYATILLVLSLIITITIICKLYEKRKLYFGIASVIFIISCLPSIGYDMLIIVKEYQSVNEIITEYKLNFSKLLKDRNNSKVEIDGIFGAIADDSLLPSLLRKDNEIYNLEEWVTITNDKTQKMYENKILNKSIYVFADDLTIELKKDYLNRNNFEILEINELEGEYNFLSPTDKLYLLKVQKQVINQ